MGEPDKHTAKRELKEFLARLARRTAAVLAKPRRWSNTIAVWAGIAAIVQIPVTVAGLIWPSWLVWNEDRLVHVIQVVSRSEDFEPSERLTRAASRLVTRNLNVVHPGSDPFVLKEGAGLYLGNGSGQRMVFSMGRMFPANFYVYAGAGGKHRKLRMGERAVFNIGADECGVTLAHIDQDRMDATFSFDCGLGR